MVSWEYAGEKLQFIFFIIKYSLLMIFII